MARDKRAEESAEAIRESLLELIEATDAIVVVLDSEGKIRYTNRAFEEVSGYGRDELENADWFETLAPKDRYPQVWQEFKRLAAAGAVDRFENPILTKSGEERYIVWRNSTLRQQKKIVGTASIGIDISERKQAEEALADSERKLLSVFTSVPVSIVVSDPVDGRFWDVNQEFERMFECAYDDVVGKTSVELGLWTDPNDRQRLLEMVERDGEVRDQEFALRTLGGKELTVRANVLPATVGGSRYLLYALADITERKQMEEQLEMLKLSIDVHPAGAYWLNSDGEFVYANEAGCRAVGYELEELLGQSISLVNPAATPEQMKLAWEKLRSEGSLTAETVHRRKDGSEFPAEITAAYVEFGGKEYNCGFAQDISERKRSGQQIEVLTRWINVHPDGAFWVDTNDEIAYVSDTVCRNLGYEREELLGKPASFVNPQATPERMKGIWETLRRDGSLAIEAMQRRKDGTLIPIDLMAALVRYEGNEYFCGFTRDISQRKHAEEERALLAKQLQQAQKMEAVGRLAGGVAHSFNNILTALGGYCELLLAKLPEESNCRPEAEQIKRASDHAAAITRELLLFSRREAARRVRLDLNTVVVQSQLLLRELIRSDIKIVTALAPVVPLVLADHSQIEQVIVNLAVNASDAMPGGGVIAIETADLELGEPLLAGDATLDAGRYVSLVVSDSGTGMDESTLAHIFEPFFSTKGPDKGSGLGLATVYGIVEESGGRIHVDSKPGTGTKFTVFLPALPARG
ncbi:MAG: PAS domain S-box protein [Gaiellaceae bacterium]